MCASLPNFEVRFRAVFTNRVHLHHRSSRVADHWRSGRNGRRKLLLRGISWFVFMRQLLWWTDNYVSTIRSRGDWGLLGFQRGGGANEGAPRFYLRQPLPDAPASRPCCRLTTTCRCPFQWTRFQDQSPSNPRFSLFRYPLLRLSINAHGRKSRVCALKQPFEGTRKYLITEIAHKIQFALAFNWAWAEDSFAFA